MNEHISADLALILAALDADDPERVAAHAHAAQCPQCARLLDEGAAMLALIDAQAAELAIDPRLKNRILDAVAELPQAHHGVRAEHIGLMLGATLSVLLAWLDGHGRIGLFPARGHLCMMWEVLGASLAMLGARLWTLGLRPGRLQATVEPLRVALIAMAGGLGAQLFLHWRCPTSDAGLHLVVFHATGVMATALLGLLAGRVWRWRSS
jgi:hypothetical protein